LERIHGCNRSRSLFFDFINQFYPKPIENTVQTITKQKWVKEDKTVVNTSHPPMENLIIKHLNTEVKASPFKTLTSDDDTRKILEQNNFTNQCLHVIGKQLDKIEEKIESKPQPKQKPLITPEIKLGNALMVNSSRPVQRIEQMLKDLAESSKTIKVVSFPQSSDTETSSGSDSDTEIDKIEKAFSNLELRRIHKPSRIQPTTLTKNWYPRPTPPDVQYEERHLSSQFAVSPDKLYEWNIDGLSEQEILNKLTHMSMVANSYYNNHMLTSN
jgi:hypothetical protein